ncbi:hypothetical protein EJO68_09820 [Variovorax atrisoli]|uniref:hypothetical protein n=1 Tax=Variovorax atrisoli TaxID=3394203 RepID=UPI000F7F79B6|nr:hypothetical protein [Variovorax sp. 369]RTD94097.1 hypothetical protein EJO68_09820 [Variovorax sp. 369]
MTLAFACGLSMPAGPLLAQVSTLGKAAMPPVFADAKTAFDALGDYSPELGQVKILKPSPLHVQIKAEVEAATVRISPSVMVEQTAEVLAYGLFRMFIHTKANEVTVTALPVLQTFSDKGSTEKVLKDKSVQVRMTRAQAEQIARNVVGVQNLNDLVAKELVGWGWSKPMQMTLGQGRGSKGVDPTFLKALGLQVNSPK